MPELPEVETIVQGLRENILGKRIVSISRSEKKFRKPDLEVGLSSVQDAVVRDVKRRAKYILIYLQSRVSSLEQMILVVHLGMSGKLLFQKKYNPQKHDHMVLTLGGGECVVFNDPRRFGSIMFFTNEEALLESDVFKNLGFEPLDEEFTAEALGEILLHSRKNIKSVLMDGNKIVGVGNIYASEALFESQISPVRVAGSISVSERKRLHTAIIGVLKDAINSGGSTLRDYVRSDGDVGGFQHKFKVYGRKGMSCFMCNNVIGMVRIGGRSTFFCSKCQK